MQVINSVFRMAASEVKVAAVLPLATQIFSWVVFHFVQVVNCLSHVGIQDSNGYCLLHFTFFFDDKLSLDWKHPKLNKEVLSGVIYMTF